MKQIRVRQKAIIANRDYGRDFDIVEITLDNGEVESCDGCRILGESEIIYVQHPGNFSVYLETTAPIRTNDGRYFE